MKDLTKGYPAKVIIMFALPLMIGNILQQFYNITDSKIVSEYIGTDALAAVGATAIISNTLTGLVNGFTQGFGILIARCFGEKNYDSLRKYVSVTVKLTAASALVLLAFGEVFVRKFLFLLNTPADILDDSTAYIRIIIAGIVFISLYNMCANILRALGNSKGPLICLAISIVVNLLLDLIFIRSFNMGIKGAAYATIISQAISGICCGAMILKKYREILPHKAEWKPGKIFYKNMIPQALSMGLMGCIVNIGSIILQGAINGLGKEYVTAHISGRRVLDIMMIMIYTIGLSMTTYVSQNLGAREYKRIRKGILHALIIDTIIASFLILFAYTVGGNIVRWIASTDDELIVKSGIKYIRVSSLFFYVLGPLFILRCSLQGLGQKIVPLISSGLELTIKVFSAFVLVARFEYTGVIFTEPISWVIMIIPLIVVYLVKRPGKNVLTNND